MIKYVFWFWYTSSKFEQDFEKKKEKKEKRKKEKRTEPVWSVLYSENGKLNERNLETVLHLRNV